jgi:hypothetical protein
MQQKTWTAPEKHATGEERRPVDNLLAVATKAVRSGLEREVSW